MQDISVVVRGTRCAPRRESDSGLPAGSIAITTSRHGIETSGIVGIVVVEISISTTFLLPLTSCAAAVIIEKTALCCH